MKKLSRNEMKSLNGGIEVGNGVYACCVGRQCSTTVNVAFSDDLTCAPGTALTRLGPYKITVGIEPE